MALGLPRPRIAPSLEALLADPEVAGVLNLTPAPFHHEVNVAALQAGKHVFSEKPIAGTVADARASIALARERGLTFLCAPAVMATNRFRWLKEQLDAGWLGRPTLAVGQYGNMGPAAWRDYKGDPAVFYGTSVGPALDLGVYILHAITGLFGPARRVEAFGGISIPKRNVLIPGREGQIVEVLAPDHLLIHLDFGENRFAQVLSSFATPRSKAPMLELHGELGTVSISQEDWYDTDCPGRPLAARREPRGAGAVDAGGATALAPHRAPDPGRSGALRRRAGRRPKRPSSPPSRPRTCWRSSSPPDQSIESGCAVETKVVG